MSKGLNITVYCGSSNQVPQKFLQAAEECGRAIAAKGAQLVYGAGRTGLMGAVADAVLAAGGCVYGVIPEFMVERDWNHKNLQRMDITPDMHQRKAQMLKLATGVIALPGGIGTFEELTEAITWRQLGLYSGNIVICNVDGYYNSFIEQLNQAIENGFMKPDHLKAFVVTSNPIEAVRLALEQSDAIKFSAKF